MLPTDLLTITELSKIISVSPDTLYQWRHRGYGPRSTKAGRRVLYRRSDVDAWLESNSTAPAAVAS